jgi:hypothetical protein
VQQIALLAMAYPVSSMMAHVLKSLNKRYRISLRAFYMINELVVPKAASAHAKQHKFYIKVKSDFLCKNPILCVKIRISCVKIGFLV